MDSSSPWPMIHTERAALADDLEHLTDEQWQTPSLCTQWTVQQALAHMTATATMTPPRFFRKLAAARFRFADMSARDVARHSAGTPAETLAAFRAHVGDSTAPPGPVDSWLGETIVHSQDIRRPLGIAHDYSPEALVRVAEFYRGSNLLIGTKRRIEGLALTATDTDWTSGTGAEVRGPMLSLLMAMTGRVAALADLTGDGVRMLSSRTAAAA